jgi:methionyl-tRNA formyltransferase
LVNGTATLTAQNLAAGNYYGGRKPEDGRVQWQWSATQVHNLIRAVAPPYPGAFCDLNGKRFNLLGSIQLGEKTNVTGQPALLLQDNQLYLRCNDGGLLRVTQAALDDTPLTTANFQQLLGGTLAPLPTAA